MRIVGHVIFKTLCVGFIAMGIAATIDVVASASRLSHCACQASDQGLVP